jgi:hypothetical protein
MGKDKVYVVGQFIKETEDGPVWEMQGVFSSEEKAVKACSDNDNYFVGPLNLDEELPHKRMIKWFVAYYPKPGK